ncbi:hypothetical protein GCK32_014001, partial [Trichostrongylus colubriformis]
VVNGNKLIGNPVDLPYICLPWVNAKDRVNRMFYKKWQEIPKNPHTANVKPIQVFQDMARDVFSCDVADDAKRNGLLNYFDDGNGYQQIVNLFDDENGYQHRRCTL